MAAENILTSLALSTEPELDNALEKVLARDPETGEVKEVEVSAIAETPTAQQVFTAGSTATVESDAIITHGSGADFSQLELSDGFAALSAGDATFSMNADMAQIDVPLTAPDATQPGEVVNLGQLEAATSGSVQSVTGDSVNNTDPQNPVINAIRRAGTLSGAPVTGNVEFNDYRKIYAISSINPDVTSSFFFDDGNVGIKQENSDTGFYAVISPGSQGSGQTGLNIDVNDPASKGLIGIQDFSANNDGTDRNVYVQEGRMRDYVDNREPTQIQFTPATAPAHLEGLLYYDSDAKTFVAYDDIAGTALNVGYEVNMKARNSTGATLTNGSVVYISGATGQNPTISLAKADALATSSVIGIVTADIANNTVGKVTLIGTVNDLDTSAFTDGATVYLSAATAGLLTTTPPTSPNFLVKVGIVQHAHPTQGKIAVHADAPLARNTALTDSGVAPTTGAVKAYVDAKTFDLFNTTTQVTTVGNTSENIIYTCFIPAGTLSDGVLSFKFPNVKTGTGATTTYRVRTNTTNTLGTVIATYASQTALFVGFTRLMGMLNGTTLTIMSASAPLISDLTNLSGGGVSTITLNPAVDNWVHFTIQHGNTTDSTTTYGGTVSFNKSI